MRTFARVGVALLFAMAVVFCADAASYAVDCVGPDDPPGCTTPPPTATVTVTETASPGTQDVHIVDTAVPVDLSADGDARGIAIGVLAAGGFMVLLAAARVVHAWGTDRG